MSARLALALVALAAVLSALVSVYDQLAVVRSLELEDPVLTYEESSHIVSLTIHAFNPTRRGLDARVLGVRLYSSGAAVASLRSPVDFRVPPGSSSTIELALSPLVPPQRLLDLVRDESSLEIEIDLGLPVRVFGLKVAYLPFTVRARRG